MFNLEPNRVKPGSTDTVAVIGDLENLGDHLLHDFTSTLFGWTFRTRMHSTVSPFISVVVG